MNNIGKDPQDRSIGEYWEDCFCEIANRYGWEAWPFQRKRGANFEYEGTRFICPDVWILKREHKQYACEIKHKNQTRGGCYGFEEYRANSLLKLEQEYSNQFGNVIALYVVHNWARAGGKHRKENREDDWHAQTLKICEDTKKTGWSKTLYNGKVTLEPVKIHYYINPWRNFKPLRFFLE